MFTWILYSPIGALLARGSADTERDAHAAALAKLASMGRKRGRVQVERARPARVCVECKHAAGVVSHPLVPGALACEPCAQAVHS